MVLKKLQFHNLPQMIHNKKRVPQQQNLQNKRLLKYQVYQISLNYFQEDFIRLKVFTGN